MLGRRNASEAKESTSKLPLHAAINNDEKTNEKKMEDSDAHEDDVELGDGVYIVEGILGHRVDVPQDTIRYRVKWEGYDRESDQTWEPEENLKNNTVLDDYLKAVGGREKIFPEKKNASSVTKKGGRPTGRGGVPSKRSNSKYPRLATSQASLHSAAWSPPSGSWEDHIDKVDAVKDEKTGDLMIYLTWKNGRNTKHSTEVVYKRCPQKMLRFYERRVKIVKNIPM